MPAETRGSVYAVRGGYGIRYRDTGGQLRRRSPFPTKRAARAWFEATVLPELRGEPSAPPEITLTLRELVEVYLERHAANVRPRTIDTLRERLLHATRAWGDVPLRDLERMSGDIASWQARLPERSRDGVVQALRQTLAAAVRWGYMSTNPASLAGRNRQPSPRTIRTYTRGELDAIGAEMSHTYRTLPAFAAATGLRPEELFALERRDVDRHARSSRCARRSPGERRRAGQVRWFPAASAALATCPGSARRAPAAARHAARLPGPAWRSGVHRQLALPRVGSGRRGGRDRPTGAPVRHARDVRLRRAPRGRARVHRREDHALDDDRERARTTVRRRVCRLCAARLSLQLAPRNTKAPPVQGFPGDGSDGTRTRDLRRDRPAL